MDNMFDQWMESILANTDDLHEQRTLEETTVINLSNPQVGDVFTFLPNEFWEVVRVLPVVGECRYNRAILMLKNATDQDVYTVPQRVNGNLERRTLHAVPRAFVRNLRSGEVTRVSGVAEVDMILSWIDLPIAVGWSEKHQGWSFDMGLVDQPSSRDSRIAQLQWAIAVQGADYRGPFVFVRYGEQGSTDTEKARHQALNWFVYFDPLADSPEPDATLLDQLPRRLQRVEVDPDDIELSVVTLLKYFDGDDLIRMIQRLR